MDASFTNRAKTKKRNYGPGGGAEANFMPSPILHN